MADGLRRGDIVRAQFGPPPVPIQGVIIVGRHVGPGTLFHGAQGLLVQ